MIFSIWLVIILLIAVNALYVAAEFSAVSVRRSAVRKLADEGNLFARQLLPAIQDATELDRYIAVCQIGITISSLVLGAFGQATLARELSPLFARWGGLQAEAAQAASAVIVLMLLTFLQVIFGELVPKSLALQYSTQAALGTVMPMRWSVRFFSWFVHVLNGSGIIILKWLRVPYGRHRHVHSPEEIELLIAESRDGGLLEEDEHHRLHEALHLTTRTAGELMVPRRYVKAVDIDMPLENVVIQVGEGPYTRVPIYRSSIDNILGIVHAKDLILRYLGPAGLVSLSEVMRPAVFVPENVTVDRLLTIMRKQRSHQAVVIDEYGGMKGLVTLEDVLTELLGEVGDEFKDCAKQPELLPDGRIRFPGRTRLDSVEKWTGAPWEGSAITIGGHVNDVLGHIPVVGEQVTIHGMKVEVELMENHTVVSVLVTPLLSTEEKKD